MEPGMALTIYGIKNCDTMKKAFTWLESQGIAYTFHDYKKAGIDPDRLRAWVDKVGWEPLLNKAGTTFKKLPETEKINIDAARAIHLMASQPSMIKRPVFDKDGAIFVGFRPETGTLDALRA
jgi:Spx/MgsR family transcriptional regulator